MGLLRVGGFWREVSAPDPVFEGARHKMFLEMDKNVAQVRRELGARPLAQPRRYSRLAQAGICQHFTGQCQFDLLCALAGQQQAVLEIHGMANPSHPGVMPRSACTPLRQGPQMPRRTAASVPSIVPQHNVECVPPGEHVCRSKMVSRGWSHVRTAIHIPSFS